MVDSGTQKWQAFAVLHSWHFVVLYLAVTWVAAAAAVVVAIELVVAGMHIFGSLLH